MKKLIPLLIFACFALLWAAPLVAEEVVGGGDIVYSKPVKAVLFSHKYHVEDMGMPCDMCHAGLFEMSALSAEASPDFTMKGLEQGKFCGKCHSPEGGAFASNTQCARCHVGVKGYNALKGEPQQHSEH